MSQRIRFRNLALALAGAFLISATPATAQTTNHPSLKVNPSQGVRAAPRVAPKPKTSTSRTTTANSARGQAQAQNTRSQDQYRQCQPAYRYDNYNGYHVPVYPGPDAPLPQGGYYDPYYNNGYYNNGYYNNGYNNGYYNNGYYSNGYNNTPTGPLNSSGFPPFQRY